MIIRSDKPHVDRSIEVSAKELKVGMILHRDLETSDGKLLLRKDTPLNDGLIERIVHFAARQDLRPIYIALPKKSAADPNSTG